MTGPPSIESLYRSMARARAFELLQLELWREGRISGELHLGTGEEAVAAGIAALLEPDDAVALDHRPTPMMLLRGVDPVAMVRELVGREDGLCGGMGGHMHLMDPQRLAAASGIVGAAAPTGAGFALAARRLRPGSVALAFFGDGAINQGMVMETLNLAVAWSLPLVFVCKDNGWAITTESRDVTGGDLVDRAAAFGMPARSADGLDPRSVREATGPAVDRARTGRGPSFLLYRCARLDGHMAGDVLGRMADRPLTEGRDTIRQVTGAVLSRGGGSLKERAASLASISGRMLKVRGQKRDAASDPVVAMRKVAAAEAVDVDTVDAEVLDEMAAVRAEALGAP